MSSGAKSTSSAGVRTSGNLLAPRGLAGPDGERLPTVALRSLSRQPGIYRKMIGEVDATAEPGDLVRVRTSRGEHFGYGIYNPRAEITLRMMSYEESPPTAEFWRDLLRRAVSLRRDMLKLDEVTDAYRVIYGEADGLPGIVVDRYGDILSAEVYSLGMWQRAEALLQELAPLLGTTQWLIQTPPQTHGQEGFLAEPVRSPGLPSQTVIQEFGTKFRVDFGTGHKTGFFCDQRDNRRQLASFCAGQNVLDLCCYTGGFAIQAKRLGQAAQVTAVDLDEQAIAVAKANAKLNQVTLQLVHADVFGWMRDMLRNGRQFDVVVLDPPKLIRSRVEIDEGTKKHYDLNRLAVQLVKPGGLLLTCSCAGLLEEAEFLRQIHNAARHVDRNVESMPTAGDESATSQPAFRSNPGRTLQILARTAASADHPTVAHCPETDYLKAVWLRVW